MTLESAPALNASSCTRRRGLTNANVALTGLRLLKLTLFVGTPLPGADRYQAAQPQSMTPAGYWPNKRRFGFGRSSNVIVCATGAGGVAVATGVNVGFMESNGVAVAVATATVAL